MESYAHFSVFCVSYGAEWQFTICPMKCAVLKGLCSQQVAMLVLIADVYAGAYAEME